MYKTLLIGLLGGLLASLPALGASPEDFKLVPGNAFAVTHVDLKKLWDSEHSKDFRELLKRSGPKAIAELQRRFVPNVTTLESITAFAMFPSGPGKDPEVVFMVRLGSPVNEVALRSSFPEAQTIKKGGIDILVQDGIGLVVLNQGKTIAGGTPDLLPRLGKETVAATGDFEKFLKADSSDPVRLGVNFSAAPKEVSQGAPPPFNSLVQGLQFLDSSVSIEKNLKWKARIAYEKDEQARASHESIKGFAQMALMQMRQPRMEIENRLFPKDRPGVAPLTELPEFVGGMFGLAMLNEAEAFLKNPPITQVGASLNVEYTFPQISSGAMMPTLAMGVGLMLPAVQKVREAASRTHSMNNLKQIALAMHNYHDTYNGFPPAAICDKKTGKPLLSWRVAILPFIEEFNLYKQFKLDEPWDSAHNLKLAQKMPKVYFHPKANQPGDNKTHYRIFYGNGALFDLTKQTKMQTITDGTSNTILTVEAEEPVLWTNPNDLAFDPAKPLPKLLNSNGTTTIGIADGSVRAIRMPVDPKTLLLLIQKGDGNPIPDLR